MILIRILSSVVFSAGWNLLHWVNDFGSVPPTFSVLYRKMLMYTCFSWVQMSKNSNWRWNSFVQIYVVIVADSADFHRLLKQAMISLVDLPHISTNDDVRGAYLLPLQKCTARIAAMRFPKQYRFFHCVDENSIFPQRIHELLEENFKTLISLFSWFHHSRGYRVMTGVLWIISTHPYLHKPAIFRPSVSRYSVSFKHPFAAHASWYRLH